MAAPGKSEEKSTAEAQLRDTLLRAKRVVVKLGSRVVIGDDGKAATGRLASVVEACMAWRRAGKEVLIVSSGAVGLGRRVLGMSASRKLSLREKQACAAVGQAHLVQAYHALFEKRGGTAAQVLLTADDFADRGHYLNLKDTLDTLLAMGVVPVINENDTVSVAELETRGKTRSFGDNDSLSALVAGKSGAQLLLILTDVDGIYDDNPRLNPGARHHPLIPDFETLTGVRNRGKSTEGRGGMASKVHAARVAAICGVATVITSGCVERPLSPLPGEPGAGKATLVSPKRRIAEKKAWIAHSSGYAGVLRVNPGAAAALARGDRSLLPVGVVAVEGRFAAGAVVSLQTEEGAELGRGKVNYSAEELKRVKGLKGKEALAAVESGGVKRKEEVVHRDDLVMFQA
ncbi:MAG: glutamate 5-kinase [Bdellovibrionales bacterium]|nr:glutamate 5-kinase [Bdellovibrionales bacterium]